MRDDDIFSNSYCCCCERATNKFGCNLLFKKNFPPQRGESPFQTRVTGFAVKTHVVLTTVANFPAKFHCFQVLADDIALHWQEHIMPSLVVKTADFRSTRDLRYCITTKEQFLPVSLCQGIDPNNRNQIIPRHK